MAKKKKYYYNKKMVNEMSFKAIKKAYKELKPIAKKRISRLKKAGYGDYDIANIDLPPIKGSNITELGEALVELSLFLRDPRSLISKLKKIESQIKSTLKKHGYKVKNVKRFGEIMQLAKARIYEKMFDSYRAVMLEQQAERHNISRKSFEKNFEYFYENLETLTATAPIERADGKPVTAANLIQKMKRAKWQEAGRVYLEDHGEIWSS